MFTSSCEPAQFMFCRRLIESSDVIRQPDTSRFDPRHSLTHLVRWGSPRDLDVTADDFFEAFEAAADGFDSVPQQPLVCRLTLTERFA